MIKNSWFLKVLVLVTLSGCYPVKPKDLRKAKGRDCPEIQARSDNDTGSVIQKSGDPFGLFSKGLYKANLKIKKHELSGFLLIKRIDPIDQGNAAINTADKVYRIVFANQIGMTFFDLELSSADMRVVSCLGSLDRKALMNILRTDFTLLLSLYKSPSRVDSFRDTKDDHYVEGYKSGKYEIWRKFNSSCDTLRLISGRSNPADVATITYRYQKPALPATIMIENPFIGLKMGLRWVSD